LQAAAVESDAEAQIAERVVALKNPTTGEIELKEEKMLVNVQGQGDDDEEAADEVDDSKSDDPLAAYTKTSKPSPHFSLSFFAKILVRYGLK
jgi:hypothetical protein